MGGCDGGDVPFGIDYATAHDICTEDGYATAYLAKDGNCSKCKKVGVQQGMVLDWKQVAPEQRALMEAVAQQPVTIAVDAGGAFMFYQGGVLTKIVGGSLDHAVLLVGYGTDG